MKKQSILCAIELVWGAVSTLFIAGVIVPSMVQSKVPVSHAGFAAALHIMRFSGMTFTFSVQNIIFAGFGAAFGAVIALVLSLPMATRMANGWKSGPQFVTAEASPEHHIEIGAAI